MELIRRCFPVPLSIKNTFWDFDTRRADGTSRKDRRCYSCPDTGEFRLEEIVLAASSFESEAGNNSFATVAEDLTLDRTRLQTMDPFECDDFAPCATNHVTALVNQAATAVHEPMNTPQPPASAPISKRPDFYEKWGISAFAKNRLQDTAVPSDQNPQRAPQICVRNTLPMQVVHAGVPASAGYPVASSEVTTSAEDPIAEAVDILRQCVTHPGLDSDWTHALSNGLLLLSNQSYELRHVLCKHGWNGNQFSGPPNRQQLLVDVEALREGRGAVASSSSSLQDSSGPDNSSQFVPDNSWTTRMIRNIPNDYTRNAFLELLDFLLGSNHMYDFVYVPFDWKKGSNLGYAFVNFISRDEAERCAEVLNGFKDWAVPSEKVCEVAWAKPDCQNLIGNVERWRNNSVMHPDVPEEFKPLIFTLGQRTPFPAPTRRIDAPIKSKRVPRHASA